MERHLDKSTHLRIGIGAKKMEMDVDLILHVIHISGRRMIAQRMDGLSRADHSEGVMQEKPIDNFIPLLLGAQEREAGLRP